MTTGYFVRMGEENRGPLTKAELLALHEGGTITDAHWVWREGTAGWKPFREIFEAPAAGPPPLPGSGHVDGVDLHVSGESPAGAPEPPPLWKRFSDSVGDVAGLEKLEGFSVKHLFSEVFKKHTPEEIEEHFVVGTPRTTPPLAEVASGWPTPWAFVRMLVVTVAVTLAFHVMLGQFRNAKIIPAWIFCGSFAIPFSTMVFFFEMNSLKNIPFLRVMKLVLVGGLVSLFISLVLFSALPAFSWMGAMLAGPVEETAKLLTAIYCARKWKGCWWTLNGILIGAAVGMGFSAFESAGYVFEHLILSMHTRGGDPENVMLLRMLTAPFTHLIWTGMTVGALWKVRGERAFDWQMLADPGFLRIFGLAVLLHMLWNSPLNIPLLGGLGLIIKMLAIGITGWIVILMLVQSGLKQIQRAKAAA